MRIVGRILYSEEELIYSEDMKEFKQGGKEKLPSIVDSEYIKDWAFLLSKPWSYSDLEYITKIYQNSENENDKYVTIYQVTCYDGIISDIRGYGETPQESMQNCIDNYNNIQEKYNKED